MQSTTSGRYASYWNAFLFLNIKKKLLKSLLALWVVILADMNASTMLFTNTTTVYETMEAGANKARNRFFRCEPYSVKSGNFV